MLLMEEDLTETKSSALILLMRLLKIEAVEPGVLGKWSSMTLSGLIKAVLKAGDGGVIRQEFAEKYLHSYDDVRFHTFSAITYDLPSC